MKQVMVLMLLMVWAGLSGCSMDSTRNRSGIPVVFDGTPQIFDSSVLYRGNAVGWIVAQEWGNGVTRLRIEMESQHDVLKKSNLAAVAKNGRLHLTTMSAHGETLAPDACINGFVNTASYNWFKFKHLIGNITVSADRRAQALLARSGLSG